jgi:hypothetical protein
MTNMKTILQLGFCLSLIFSLVACKTTNTPQSGLIEHEVCNFKLLNKEEGAKAVVKDDMENYFEMVTPLEMSVMLKMESPAGERTEILDAYKKLLQEDVMDFTAEEQAHLKKIFTKALDYCAKIKPDLNLPEIHLIKTKGAYYGPSVYYTREHCIVIPAPQIGNEKSLFRTMLHEIFHVYSRFNKDKRDALYAEIGYQKLDKLELSPFLKQRIIYNPDGVDVRYAIEVQDSSGRSFKAIPAIYSRFSSYRMMPLLSTFLFQLFEVEEVDGVWKVVNDGPGYSQDQVSNYWNQIGENTQYTIHPDEVLADNFVFLAIAKAEGEEQLKKYGPKGEALIRKIEAIIKE